jgi:hypothetical protein
MLPLTLLMQQLQPAVHRCLAKQARRISVHVGEQIKRCPKTELLVQMLSHD